MSIVLDGTTGITAPAVDAAVNGSDLVDGSITQAKLATLVVPIGVGQTWQQPSRSAGVTYTNSTGRPIMAVISCASGTINGFVHLTIGSTVVSYANWSHNVGSISSGVTLVAIIPNGSTYFVTNNGFSITYWNELR